MCCGVEIRRRRERDRVAERERPGAERARCRARGRPLVRGHAGDVVQAEARLDLLEVRQGAGRACDPTRCDVLRRFSGGLGLSRCLALYSSAVRCRERLGWNAVELEPGQPACGAFGRPESAHAGRGRMLDDLLDERSLADGRHTTLHVMASWIGTRPLSDLPMHDGAHCTRPDGASHALVLEPLLVPERMDSRVPDVRLLSSATELERRASAPIRAGTRSETSHWPSSIRTSKTTSWPSTTCRVVRPGSLPQISISSGGGVPGPVPVGQRCSGALPAAAGFARARGSSVARATMVRARRAVPSRDLAMPRNRRWHAGRSTGELCRGMREDRPDQRRASCLSSTSSRHATSLPGAPRPPAPS
jgi:hypothetical protein